MTPRAIAIPSAAARVLSTDNKKTFINGDLPTLLFRVPHVFLSLARQAQT
jgi:hypothetical protein